MTVVVDTSALVAVLRDEPEREAFVAVLTAEPSVMSAATLVELRRVTMAWGPPDDRIVDDLLALYGIAVVAFDERQAALAHDGMIRFGKGRREPPAVLNFGDLFSYALARALNAPLLFKGDDFGCTDVRARMVRGA